MVEAVDHEVKITVTQVPDSKTRRLTCSGCDWMETAGSPSAATRKSNIHRDEHRAALHGAPGVPTIIDAIEGDVELPEGSFREVEHHLEVVDIIDPDDTEGVSDDPDFGGEVLHTAGVPIFHTKACRNDDAICDGSHGCYEISTGTPVLATAVDKEAFHFPRLDDARAAAAEMDARVSEVGAHTRTTTDIGPDFCAECSHAIQDWVPWPCGPVVDRGRLAVALTKARLADQKGPSDFDKDLEDSEWHRARAESVSATLAAKLGSAADVDYLIAREVRERLGGSRFWGNAYTRWGREREPFLEQAGLARHGIEGEDCLFYSRANRRHVASPDGIAIHPENGEVALGEYKTSGKELTWAKVIANGYYDQVQWQLYVMEAHHCWLMWEWRHGEGANYDTYVPQVGGEHLIMRDEARIAELVSRADRFLAALDEARTKVEGLEETEQIDPQLYWLVDQHLEAKAAAKLAEEQLREYCEATGVKSMEIPGVAKVSYSWGSGRSRFDRERFDADHPGMYDQYVEPGAPPERPTLRVTPVKGDDEQ